MKLCLEFYRNATDQTPMGARCELPVPPLSSATGTVPVGPAISGEKDDSVYVKAWLEDPIPANADGRFLLKLPGNPDYAEHWSDASGIFCTYAKQKNTQNTPFRNTFVQLFRGTSGFSYLVLFERPSASHGACFPLAEFPVSIKLSADQEADRKRMAEELLDINPEAIISEVEGVAKPGFARRWGRGGGRDDLWELQAKCEELERLFEVIVPQLAVIRKACAISFVMTEEKVPLGKLRHWTPRSFLDLSKMERRGGRPRVSAIVPRPSFGIPIHCGIKDSLMRILYDMDAMLTKLRASLREDRQHLQAISFDRYGTEDKEAEIKVKETYLDRFEKLKQQCVSLLSDYYPWANVKRREITTIPPGAVPDTPAYQSVYHALGRFLRRRFSRCALSGLYDVPEYLQDPVEEEEFRSVWQKKYSGIFEGWVFWRLVKAFMSAGFSELGTGFHARLFSHIQQLHLNPVSNDSITACLKSKNGDLQITLYRNVVGYLAKHNPAVFKSYSKLRISPDFAIVFQRPDGRTHWIVLDAKAWPKLKMPAIDSRDKYLNLICLCRNNSRPDQSWLIYTGSYQLSRPGMEMFQNKYDGRCWDSDTHSNAVLARNHGFSRAPGHGEITGFSPSQNRTQFVGHLRVNATTLARARSDVFTEFARMQIATAKAQFGIP